MNNSDWEEGWNSGWKTRQSYDVDRLADIIRSLREKCNRLLDEELHEIQSEKLAWKEVVGRSQR